MPWCRRTRATEDSEGRGGRGSGCGCGLGPHYYCVRSQQNFALGAATPINKHHSGVSMTTAAGTPPTRVNEPTWRLGEQIAFATLESVERIRGSFRSVVRHDIA